MAKEYTPEGYVKMVFIRSRAVIVPWIIAAFLFVILSD
jgi:hypothetical protein